MNRHPLHHDFHLTCSDSTARLLQQAITEKLLSGKVGGTQALLNLGPLHDGYQRALFLRHLYATAYPDRPQPALENNAFYTWKQLQNSLQKEPPDRLLIWINGSASSYVFPAHSLLTVFSTHCAVVLRFCPC